MGKIKCNKIQGTFPPSICNMSQLTTLDMSNNFFYGVIPECFGNISDFPYVVDLGNNHFHGTIPKVYNDCYLQGLILNGNQLEGEVPTSLSICQSLEILDLGNNHLNGTFPSWLDDLPELQVLVFKSNNFHGPIRTSSVIEHPFPRLQILDLSQNGFVGELPEKYFLNFKAMRNLVKSSTKPIYMQSSFEDYYFSISVVFKNVLLPFTKIAVAYTIIDLSNNRFEGKIPDVIGSLDSLISLNLSHNNLKGRIPHALGKLSEIESLDLSCNQLIGKIPQQLVDLTFLAVFNVSQNHLVGRIPKGPQFNTFQGNSFFGNQELCGLPLPIMCEHPPQREEPKADEDVESGFTWKVVMLGYACGTLVGIAMGYLMLRTRRPKWFIGIVDELEHKIQRRQNKTRYVYIGR